MGLESVRINDKYETYNDPSVDHYSSQHHLNRRRKVNPLSTTTANTLNSHHYYCGSHITASNLSNGNDFPNASNYSYLWKVCKERGVLFEDPYFAASNKALFGKKESSNSHKIFSSVVWMRPFQLVSRPKYITEYNPNRRFDVEFGDGSALLSSNQPLFHATSILYSVPKLFDRVINPLQNLNPNNYAGIWKFRFWKFGQWIDIVIDDRLPTYKGRLLFMQCLDGSEFWAALLEKAYAKLYGSYDYYLKHCFTAQTTQDLTGGIAQSFTIASHERHIIHQMIASAVPRSTLLSVCINTSDANSPNKSYRLRNGLRNVCCKGEWNGAWSERSLEWDHLSERDREELTIRCRTDGEFWISFDDLLNNFTNLDLIHIGPDDWMQEISLHHKRPWRAVLARRKWKKGFNAGGSPSHKETFHTNPQFHVHIPKSGPNKLHVVVSVTQLYETNTELQDYSLQSIGFCVFEVPPNTIRLSHAFVSNNAPLDITDFTTTRESVTFFTLPAGDFIIVPSTDKPNQETKFLLRLFTDESTNIWEVNDDNIIFALDSQIPKIVESIAQPALLRQIFIRYGPLDYVNVVPQSYCAFVNYHNHQSPRVAIAALYGQTVTGVSNGFRPLVFR
ncbi:unnamed protein product, partial [Oppiella nova]